MIENLYNVNEKLELNYDKLFYSFTKIYWNLVIHHNLWQSNEKRQTSGIQRVLEEYSNKFSIPREMTFDKLPDSMQLSITKDIKKIGKKYVIGSFYSDSNSFFYEFNLKSEYLRFNKPVYKFFQKHQRIITYMTNYHLSLFLEKHNSIPDTNYLLNKVEAVSKRDTLNHYLRILSKYEDNVCFYCGRELTKAKRQTHVDHFIPWSFIQNDNLWNLVLSCQSCNIKKSDKLAEKKYLALLLDRNEVLTGEVKEKEFYLFEDYKSDKLIQLYDYSKVNGISEIWSPNN